MHRLLILVKHSHPEIIEAIPANEWQLSDNGRRRAAHLAEEIREYGPGAIATSVEPKAIETARLIAGSLGLSAEPVTGLHEHDRQNVPFLSDHEFESAIREFFDRPNELVFGNETADEAHERFRLAVEKVSHEYHDTVVVFVTHGTVISLFVSRLTGAPAFPLWKELGLPSFAIVDMKSKTLLGVGNITEGDLHGHD